MTAAGLRTRGGVGRRGGEISPSSHLRAVSAGLLGACCSPLPLSCSRLQSLQDYVDEVRMGGITACGPSSADFTAGERFIEGASCTLGLSGAACDLSDHESMS